MGKGVKQDGDGGTSQEDEEGVKDPSDTRDDSVR